MSEESIINLYSSNSLEIVLMNMINSYRSVKTSERLMMYNFHRNNFLKELILDINNLRKFLNN